MIARYEGRAPGPCVHFNGHLDVVEPCLGWSLNPFAGVVRQGRLYGRGACDMKGGIAAAVVALALPAAAQAAPAGSLSQLDDKSGCLVDRSDAGGGCTSVRALRGPARAAPGLPPGLDARPARRFFELQEKP